MMSYCIHFVMRRYHSGNVHLIHFNMEWQTMNGGARHATKTTVGRRSDSACMLEQLDARKQRYSSPSLLAR